MAGEVTVVFFDQDVDPDDYEDYELWLREKLEDAGGISVIAVDIEEA
jgi:hypothetical protein